MKTKGRLFLGIALDVVVLVGGAVASFVAFWAWSEGTLSQFWQFRAMLMMAPALVVALLSSGALRDARWRCWLRFMFFEAMSLFLLVAIPVEHFGPGPRLGESALHFGLAPLADAAIHGLGLTLMNYVLRRRSQRSTTPRPGHDAHQEPPNSRRPSSAT
ncbi:hypothetical protein A176_002307 [Myxococcus hansupus]|uniref:Uncharacterized protein n=1 Tax=Pseudomyxococcus hansupus TaxID=1297742 RepID=A0A0H4WVN6_9BACT|nr:hypothetical protein [Myxococcus hansupus]AKQ65395.1 hypothetical protein A176_002307 [Myxococcus hansupus]